MIRGLRMGLTAAALGTCFVAVGAAQDPQTGRAAAAAPPDGAVVVSGCVQRGEADGSIAGTPLGTSVPPADAGAVANLNPAVGFLLTDATPLPARDGAHDAPAGTAGSHSGSADADRTSYALHGAAEALGRHVGRRMEVTGTLVPSAASNDRGTAAAADGARAHAGEPVASAGGDDRSDPLFRSGIRRLKVLALKPAPGDCRPAR